jgi:glycosyltransferase involved in cell wall biosynthesis
MIGKKKRLKIAILIRNFVTTGGAERYAMEVTRRLAKDHEVHVFAQEWTYYGNEKIYFHRIPKYFERPSFLNQLVFLTSQDGPWIPLLISSMPMNV